MGLPCHSREEEEWVSLDTRDERENRKNVSEWNGSSMIWTRDYPFLWRPENTSKEPFLQ